MTRTRIKTGCNMETFLVMQLLDQFGPRLRERGHVIARIKAMKKKRLELVKANRLLIRKISEYK